MSAEYCGALVARCFEARTQAHVAHLLTTSYAAHKALDEFYSGIVDLADSVAEAATGRYGLLQFPGARPKIGDTSKPITIPEELRTWIDEYRGKCGSAREIQNLLDGILELCDATIYKLKFLK